MIRFIKTENKNKAKQCSEEIINEWELQMKVKDGYGERNT